LTLDASLTSDGNGVKGATNTLAAFYENGMTANEYQHKLLKFTSGSNDGYYRVIDSNSNDAGTRLIYLAGRTLAAQPVANDTAEVYDWGTTVTSIQITSGQSGVNIYDLKSNGITGAYNSTYTVTRCCTNGTGTNIASSYYSTATATNCMILGVSAVQSYSTNGWIIFNGCKFVNFTAVGVYGAAGSNIYLQGGNILDGVTAGTQRNLEINGTCQGNCWCPDVYNFIKNGNFGVRALGGSTIGSTAYNSYSGNNTNESAEAASYSYID